MNPIWLAFAMSGFCLATRGILLSPQSFVILVNDEFEDGDRQLLFNELTLETLALPTEQVISPQLYKHILQVLNASTCFIIYFWWHLVFNKRAHTKRYSKHQCINIALLCVKNIWAWNIIRTIMLFLAPHLRFFSVHHIWFIQVDHVVWRPMLWFPMIVFFVLANLLWTPWPVLYYSRSGR